MAGLADWLAGRGYLLRVRRALGGSLDSLRHHFLVVQGSSCEDLIVEVSWLREICLAQEGLAQV